MVRQRWAVTGEVVLGLLVLAAVGRADEAATVKAIETLGGKVTDAGLKELKGLKNLQLLDIQRTQITDTGLKELKEVKSLRELWPAKVTDQTLRTLREVGLLHALGYATGKDRKRPSALADI